MTEFSKHRPDAHPKGVDPTPLTGLDKKYAGTKPLTPEQRAAAPKPLVGDITDPNDKYYKTLREIREGGPFRGPITGAITRQVEEIGGVHGALITPRPRTDTEALSLTDSLREDLRVLGEDLGKAPKVLKAVPKQVGAGIVAGTAKVVDLSHDLVHGKDTRKEVRVSYVDPATGDTAYETRTVTDHRRGLVDLAKDTATAVHLHVTDELKDHQTGEVMGRSEVRPRRITYPLLAGGAIVAVGAVALSFVEKTQDMPTIYDHLNTLFDPDTSLHGPVVAGQLTDAQPCEVNPSGREFVCDLPDGSIVGGTLSVSSFGDSNGDGFGELNVVADSSGNEVDLDGSKAQELTPGQAMTVPLSTKEGGHMYDVDVRFVDPNGKVMHDVTISNANPTQ